MGEVEGQAVGVGWQRECGLKCHCFHRGVVAVGQGVSQVTHARVADKEDVALLPSFAPEVERLVTLEERTGGQRAMVDCKPLEQGLVVGVPPRPRLLW